MGSISMEAQTPQSHAVDSTANGSTFEPVAIVGMAMRLPGRVHNATDFWNLLINKKSGLCEVPQDRFNIDGFYNPSGKSGTLAFNHGYFLDDIDLRQFDTNAFPIPKKELERLDPAQRQLIQVAYECMENAGCTSWRGSNMGCWVGEFGEDWTDISAKETQHRGGYRGTGLCDFAQSNRVSYELDLHGPSMTVKTACSSSLVCLDLACEAIRNGQCDAALVGGVSLLFSPTMWTALADQGLLSPTGQCNTFDACVDGYARGEAINMILIKRLSHALRDHDPIRAIIRGTAVNANGRGKALVTPNPKAQAALIRRTYEVAGIKDVTDTAIFECHGTGTPIGDPLETEAVADCFGDKGVIITSVKPNVGHSEGAAGLTSVIKSVLSLEHQLVLPNINFNTPNPKIPFEKNKLHVPTELEHWPKDRAERISVNATGIGGVNAHAIIESPRQYGLSSPSIAINGCTNKPSRHASGLTNGSAPTSNTTQHENNGGKNGDTNGHSDTGSYKSLLLFSAYSSDSLKAHIRSHQTHWSGREPKTDIAPRDLAFTLANKREHRKYRAYAVTDALTSIDATEPQVVEGPTIPSRVGWIFTGQGAQWPRMGSVLIDTNATFRATIQKLDEYLRTFPTPPSWNIEDELRKGDDNSLVHRAEFGHPLCVALQIALTDVLRSWGIVPDFVLGHSSGEVAAAYASGAISAESAMATAVLRGTANVATYRPGSMAAIGLGREEVLPYLESSLGVDIACENSHSSITLSGDTEGVHEVIARLKADKPKVFARLLKVEKAFHSHHMREYGPSYESLIKPYVRSSNPKTAFFSSVTGKKLVGEESLGPTYWRQNMEMPVLFNSALRSALREAADKVTLIEIGPHPALGGPVGQILRDMGRSQDVHLATLVRGKSCDESLLNLAGKLYQSGLQIDLTVVCPPGKHVGQLPSYNWDQDTSHWAETRVSRDWRFREYPPHELLGSRVVEMANEPCWRKMFALEDASWMDGHEINGQIVFPGAGYIAMVGEALRQLTGEATYTLRSVRLASALVVPVDKVVELITTLKPTMVDTSESSSWYEFTIMSFNGTKWSRNCYGDARASADKPESLNTPDAEGLDGPRLLPRRVNEEDWYRVLRRTGFNYTGAFAGMHSVSSATNTDNARASVPSRVSAALDKDGSKFSQYDVHPAIIDQCFQVLTVATCRGLARNMSQLAVPTFIEEISISPGPTSLTLDVEATINLKLPNGSFFGDIKAQAMAHTVVALKGLKASALTSDDGGAEEEPLVTQFEWRPHSDFSNLSGCIHPCKQSADQWAMRDELVLLCLLDHQKSIKISDRTPQHLVKFFDWLQLEIDRYRCGENHFVPNTLRLESLSDEERLARIEELVAATSQDEYRVFTEGIYRMFKLASEIFSGENHPLHILLEDNLLTRLYNAAPLDYTDTIHVLANTNPHLRILEVGAGTGGTTAKVLPALKSKYGERLFSTYTYTDVSGGFMTAARDRFSAETENMEFAVLDISKDPAEQGFQLESYDLILASNVIHATPKLSTSLKHLHDLLSPNGRLFMEELCPDALLFGYIMGYLPGWWLGEDDNRLYHPFVSPERWAKELVSVGFQKPEISVFDSDHPCQISAAIMASKEDRKIIPTDVTILCNSSGSEDHYVAGMGQCLESLGMKVSICHFGQSLPPSQAVISLLDMQGQSTVHRISEDDWGTLRGYLLAHRATMLWLMPASQLGCEDPRSAMMLGLARTARNELALQILTVEVDAATPETTATQAAARILLRADWQSQKLESMLRDFEYAVKSGEILIPRLHWQTVPQAFSEVQGEEQRDTNDMKLKHITVKTPGLLHTMNWTDGKIDDLREGEVLVETKAVGLNFRDVLIAMGVIEHKYSTDGELGIESSGIVRAVGPGVKRLAVGDRVINISKGCFTTYLTIHERLCVKSDDSIPFEQGAAVPCVYATVIIGLIDKANLKKGQSILIHAACGGVGLAAIQMSQMLGAEIYCTVGSEAKRQYLIENYGIPDDRIFNSRDSSFLPDVMKATNGRGVDVVLNSLSGDLLHASWRCVAEFGIMLEIGKRDFQRRAKLAMEFFEHNRSFVGIELNLLFNTHPESAASLVQRAVDMISSGAIGGPTVGLTFPAAHIQDAFRTMQSAKHIGKIVITFPDDKTDLDPEQRLGSVANPTAYYTPKFRPDRSYLLAGGLGGVGRAIANWMAENGARHLVFLSRNARRGPDTDAFLDELRSQGCQPLLVEGSVARLEDVKRCVKAATAATNKPIAGVINLSMVLKDINLTDMTYEDWNTAVDPKVEGTWNLHNAISIPTDDLDFFLLFSSYGCLGGQWGQANYSAANTFLDAFVQYRHQQRLVASVIDLGVMGDVGYVAKNPEVREMLSRIGMRILQEENMLDGVSLALSRSHPALDQQLNSDDTSRGSDGMVYRVPSQVVLGLNSSASLDAASGVVWKNDVRMGIYHNIMMFGKGSTNNSASGIAKHSTIKAKLASEQLSENEKQMAIAKAVAGALADFLIKDVQSIALDRPLESLGLDSLVAMELRNWIRQQTGVELSTILIVQSPSLAHLAEQIQVGMSGVSN